MPAAAPPAPSGVTIVDTPPPSAPPAPTSSIQVSQIAPPREPIQPKTGSAMDRLRSDLRGKAKDPNAPTTTTKPPAKTSAQSQSPKTAQSTPPSTTSEPAAQPPEGEPGIDPNTPGSPEGEPSSTVQPPAQPTDPKATKVSPWKLVDQYKSRIAAMEKEVAEAKSANLPEQQRKEYLTRIEEMEKRNKILEDEIRFVDYSKSQEFQSKYQQPYEAAWQRAMGELSEITLTGADGAPRAATSDDLLQLVNLPLGKAREIADEVFGAFADDVMAHRKEIRTLFDAQARALKEARENGAARTKQQQEISQKNQQELTKFISENWERAHQTLYKDPNHGKFFQPIEGDQDGNQRLAKGFELVDRAFSENPSNPNLTQEQRASIIARHVAVRNRAAAYGRLVSMVKKLEGERDALNKELAQFRGSTPDAGNSDTAPQAGATTTPPSARESIFADLRKRAR